MINRNIKILNVFATDYDDIRCNAILSVDDKEVANIIASYDEATLRYSIGNKDSEMNEEFVRKAFEEVIKNDFDDYLKLPKISECSALLQDVYDCVCSSDSCMCHIDENDWEDSFADKYDEEDIKILEKEIKKYGLSEVIGINEDDYKIIGYGDLETRFNDDRNINLNKEQGVEL